MQAFVNMSVVLGLLPTKGIPLPFVSAGGSSLVVSLAGMGVLLNISQHASADAIEEAWCSAARSACTSSGSAASG